MSRTRRNVPPRLERYIKESETQLGVLSPGTQRKMEKVKKKVERGKAHHMNGKPSPHSPKGFEPWEGTDDNHWAKRGAHKIIRQRGKDEIEEQLPEAEEAAQEVLDEGLPPAESRG